MSADNGIYIAKFPDGYRVTLAQAIENIDYFPPGSREYNQELEYYFGKSPIFADEESAYVYAHQMEDKIDKEGDYTEYGVCYIGEYESFF